MSLTEPRTLASIAEALDAFPGLTESDRAHIFHAIDTAPEDVGQEYRPSEPYGRAWLRAQCIMLSTPGTPAHPLTLHEASGYTTDPTPLEIIRALHRGTELTA